MRRLDTVPPEVLAEMPNRDNIRKSIQRERLKDLPSNPTSISDFGEIPIKFKHSLGGEIFLLYDSFENENDEGDESDEEDESRIIIFSKRSNLERLSRTKEWHVGGTFKTSPTIFFPIVYHLGV